MKSPWSQGTQCLHFTRRLLGPSAAFDGSGWKGAGDPRANPCRRLSSEPLPNSEGQDAASLEPLAFKDAGWAARQSSFDLLRFLNVNSSIFQGR